jgi:hypothetical protein
MSVRTMVVSRKETWWRHGLMVWPKAVAGRVLYHGSSTVVAGRMT